jgi:hypothetical protein
MTIYVKLREPWHRVPLLSDESIANYKLMNVDPHKGTSYGEVERIHLAELKLAKKLGHELIRLDKLEIIEQIPGEK